MSDVPLTTAQQRLMEPTAMLVRKVEAREQGTIFYTITPQRFTLDIPVEALANMNPDAHTRILAILNAWILEHKPKVEKGPTP